MKNPAQKLAFLILFLFTVNLVFAQNNLKSFYSGDLNIFGQKIGCRLHVQKTESGYTATLDIPAQGANGIPVNELIFDGQEIKFSILGGERKGAFEGKVEGDSIGGTFTQMGIKGRFAFIAGTTPVEEKEETIEIPEENLPYDSEEVTFNNGEIKFAGTLTSPFGDGPFPAVVLITGSGAQNRDEEIFGFKLFKIIADYLTREEIAVLRFDDRGIGGSTGNVNESTSEDFAGDALAGVELLKTNPKINPDHIGLFGHSEGGIVAPIAATQSEDVDFIVLMAGTGMPGREILSLQRAAISRAGGESEEAIALQETISSKIIDMILEGKEFKDAEKELIALGIKSIELMPEEQRKNIEDPDVYLKTIYKGQFAAFNTTWFKFFLVYDPAETLVYVQCPVLMLFGGKDTQVPAEANKELMEEALMLGGNTNFKSKIFPNANHLFQTADTGSPAEYSTLEKTFVPEFLDTVVGFIKDNTK